MSLLESNSMSFCRFANKTNDKIVLLTQKYWQKDFCLHFNVRVYMPLRKRHGAKHAKLKKSRKKVSITHEQGRDTKDTNTIDNICIFRDGVHTLAVTVWFFYISSVSFFVLRVLFRFDVCFCFNAQWFYLNTKYIYLKNVEKIQDVVSESNLKYSSLNRKFMKKHIRHFILLLSLRKDNCETESQRVTSNCKMKQKQVGKYLSNKNKEITKKARIERYTSN